MKKFEPRLVATIVDEKTGTHTRLVETAAPGAEETDLVWEYSGREDLDAMGERVWYSLVLERGFAVAAPMRLLARQLAEPVRRGEKKPALIMVAEGNVLR